MGFLVRLSYPSNMDANEAYRVFYGVTPQKPPKIKNRHRKNHKKSRPDYHDYIKSKQWRKIRRLQPNKSCDVCGTMVNLELHHLTYKRLGRERKDDLIWRCNEHHEGLHFSEGQFSNQKNLLALENYKNMQFLKTIN
jgi:hypothetical protein